MYFTNGVSALLLVSHNTESQAYTAILYISKIMQQ